MVCSEFAQVFRLSVSIRKVGGEHPFCVLIYMNSYMFHICCIGKPPKKKEMGSQQRKKKGGKKKKERTKREGGIEGEN